MSPTQENGSRSVSTLAALAARHITQADGYHAEHFASSLGSIGRISVDQLFSRSEALQLLQRGGLQASASFPGRIDVVSEPGRYPGPGDPAVRMPRLLDFCTIKPTDAAIVQYTQETALDTPAAETAKGSAAPEATDTFGEPIDAYVREITVAIPAHRAQVADLAELETLLEGRLSSGVRGRLEQQLVAGDGTGENLTGILTVGVPTVSRGTDELRYDVLRRGVTSVRNTLFDEPNCIAIHPNDLDDVLAERDDDNHLIVSGEERTTRTLHSVAVVPTVAAPEGSPLIGAFDLGATVRLRSGISADISDSDKDYFMRRMVSILVAMRVTVTVPTPRAFCQVNLS